MSNTEYHFVRYKAEGNHKVKLSENVSFRGIAWVKGSIPVWIAKTKVRLSKNPFTEPQIRHLFNYREMSDNETFDFYDIDILDRWPITEAEYNEAMEILGSAQ